MKLPELRAIAKDLKLPVTGKKSVLIDRITKVLPIDVQVSATDDSTVSEDEAEYVDILADVPAGELVDDYYRASLPLPGIDTDDPLEATVTAKRAALDRFMRGVGAYNATVAATGDDDDTMFAKSGEKSEVRPLLPFVHTVCVRTAYTLFARAAEEPRGIIFMSSSFAPSLPAELASQCFPSVVLTLPASSLPPHLLVAAAAHLLRTTFSCPSISILATTDRCKTALEVSLNRPVGAVAATIETSGLPNAINPSAVVLWEPDEADCKVLKKKPSASGGNQIALMVASSGSCDELEAAAEGNGNVGATFAKVIGTEEEEVRMLLTTAWLCAYGRMLLPTVGSAKYVEEKR